MAQQCPASVDVTDIQFKLQSKHKVFAENGKLRDHVNLLACASNHGLLFVGNPNAPELQAFILPDVIYAKSKSQPIHLRTTKLANISNTIACNADGSMLAVNYTVQGYGVLEIYHVPSFATADPKILYSIRLPDQNVYALQLLWNPVLPAVIGVVQSNGSFVLYTLKDGGAMEMRSIKQQQIQCGCWSPKGKQIVLGHPNGKLQQFKPDLTPAKTIICPPDIHPGPFDTIALHWLSTFQFVVSFLQQGQGTMPNIYIVNAPKGGAPVFINYNDVCYSGAEPRKQQVTFLHIAQWNLLLVTSANGVEIGLLGTKDSNDQPQWVHYMLLDEARIEMPLTEASDETYPIGLALDISPTHELTVGEKKLQTMPAIHVLSTNGDLQCFNFLNLSPNAVNICSPPAPVSYAIEKFTKLDEGSFLTKSSSAQSVQESNQNFTLPAIETPPPPPPFHTQPQTNAQNNAANQNIQAFVAPAAANKPLFSAGWEQKPQNLSFGTTTTVNDAQRNIISKPIAQAAPINSAAVTTKPTQPAEVFKPLYTVSPEFAPPQIQQQQVQQTQDIAGKSKSQLLNLNETNSVIQQMIFMQITAFEKEIKQLGQKSKLVLNDDVSTMKNYSKRLINLQEIIEQANERDFVMDVQDLRHSLTESYEMLNECRSKLNMYKNPDDIGIKYLTLYDCISQRQLKGLQNYLAINQSMMKNLEQQMDAQWSFYQDMVRRNSKYHMRVPCLDGIYQQMTKLKNLITQQQTKLHYIKSIIKQKELGNGRMSNDWRKDVTQSAKSDSGMMSLADAILSMSINNMTDAKSNKLPENKLNALRNFTRQQGKITIIKPQRPNRVELTSEVILETKLLIKRKETKDKETMASKAAEKEKSMPTLKPQQPETKQITETDFQNEFRQLPPQQRQPQSTSSIAPFGGLQQNFALPRNTNYQQAPQSTVNLSGGNMFAGTKSGDAAPELLKFGINVNTVKSGVVEVKPNTVTASNKPQFAKTKADDKTSTAANFSFTAKSDTAEIAKPAPSNIFNAASKGFAGFGQPSTNANNIFNPNPNNTVDQTNPIQKTFSFGNTFNALTPNAAKAASGVPATNGVPQTSTVSSTIMQPNIFQKQNEQKNAGPFAVTSVTGLEKASSENTPATKCSVEEVKPITTTPAQIPSTTDSDATQSQKDADDKLLKSLNICKPTAKEAAKPKEGNVFSFTSNNENNPPSGLQPMQDSKGSATVTPTTESSPSPFFGIGTTSTPSFLPFSSSSTNVPVFGSTSVSALTSSTTIATPTITSTATSIGGSGVVSSAFSFTNPTLFKQVPTFQNPTASSAAATTNSSSAAVSSSTTAKIEEEPASKADSASTPVDAAAVPTTGAATPTTAAATSTTAAPTSTAISTAPSPSTATIAAATAVTSAPTSNVTSPFFSTITKAPADSLFGNALQQPTPSASPNSSAPKSDNVSQPTATSVAAFGSMSLGSSAAPSSGGNIFGNASSGFGNPPSGLFSGAATAAMPTSPNSSAGSIFGNTGVKSGTSIFGNAASIKPAENTTGSIFGNAAAKSAESSGGSIFGVAASATKPPDNVNIFGSPTSANAATASSGSIFGQSSGSIFGAAAAASKPEATSPTAAGFSFVGSAFGTKPTVASGGSIFGGTGADAPQPQANVFGSPTSGFGAAATSPFSSFSQGSASVASTGFGSPTQQPQAGGNFSRPVFGGAPAFGSPPAFGAQPSFGGAPTFGSPKGFGSFTTPTTTSFGAPAAQGNNIFEALGSADTGLSFGNLAQTTNNPTNAPKPMFGGSSFMNYRA